MAMAEMPMRLEDGLRIVLLPTLDEVPSSPASEGQSDNDAENTADTADTADIPQHPIPIMQGAFAESLREVTNGGAKKPTLREVDAQARRERLLDQGRDDEPFDMLWRYRAGQKQHEVVKLVAQIAFGVYLLLNGMANDQAQVVTILQGHIDEVDEFLEVALEDLGQASQDMTGRIDHLQVPMQNMQVFEELLQDRKFRAEILQGNEKIEHILARTNVAMKQWDDDIDAGLRCTTAFSGWLNAQKDAPWRRDRPDLEDIFEAMKGNAEGWLNAFDEMNSLTQDINGLAIRLMTILAEMEKKAGEISRQTWASVPPYTYPINEAAYSPRASRAHMSRISQATSPRLVSRPSSRITPQASSASLPRLSSIRPVASPRSSSASQISSPQTRSEPLERPPMHDRTPSIHSRHSVRSRPTSRPSTRNGSAPTVVLATEMEVLDLDELDFPLPGSAPLLPPKSANRAAPRVAAAPKLTIDTTEKILVLDSPEQPDRADEQLYILQPRVYTPKPETPMSPMTPKIRAANTLAAQLEAQRQSTYSLLQKRVSLRQRVSMKTQPPQAIQIPPVPSIAMMQRPSTGDGTPPTGNSLAPDSAYGSDSENKRGPHRIASLNELSHGRHPAVASPLSEQHHQYYHPVRASPHSPLQQRPHTAMPGDSIYRPSASYPQYNRNQPSRLGGMSMLSNVTTMTQDERAKTPSTASQAGDRQLRKKKSTFGWLKKAFSLDEEEKAAFEARKAMRFEEKLSDPHSPKFLDGKRLR